MLMSLYEKILGLRRVQVDENQRAMHFYKGQLRGILEPGEHMLADRRNRLSLEWFDLSRPVLVSEHEKTLFDKFPDVAARHFTVIVTAADQVAVVEQDGRIRLVLGPESRLVLWTDTGPWTHQVIDLPDDLRIAPDLARRMAESGRTMEHVAFHRVPEGHVALIHVDGALMGELSAGTHAHWKVGHAVEGKIVDLRRQSLDVTGQEILTRDRVTIRVNLSADYRVVDPVKAVTGVKDYADALYRSLQFAFRKVLGAMTLDQILETKAMVDDAHLAAIRADMAEIGLEVGAIALKDVILPGEMRDILNTVVAAEKEAQANVIRRREETNATRSLLNTAKVMADNPVMLRLKELEALESVASKVERITIHNGTDGLINDLVRLRG